MARRSIIPIAASITILAANLAPAAEQVSKGPAAKNEKIQQLGDEAFRLLSRVYEYDPEIPLDARIVERTDERRGPPREKIVFRGAQGFYVPSYFQLPRDHAKPVPCVLLLHGWSGSKLNYWTDDNYISGGNVRRGLLKEGLAVFALDAQCHGDRIAENEYQPVNPSGPPGVPARKGHFTQPQIYVQTTIDYRRALDYLKGRPEIDSSRIGVFGYSMGATQTFLLMGVDSRIKAAVACALPADTNPTSLVAPRHFAHTIGSRPLFLVMSRKDEMCPPEEAERVLGLVRSPQAKLSFFEGTHKLRPDFVPHAVKFLKDHL